MREALGADPAQGFLGTAYHELGYADGALLDATDSPRGLRPDDWINKGEWLCLAKKVDAEKVFFVDHNPVIVFAQCPTDDVRLRFQQIWNMGRPPLLFLASPGELGVYDLTHGPAEGPEDWAKTLPERRLETVTAIAEVAEKLSWYRREQVESGKLFEEVRFGDEYRADKALISDLQVVRRRLIEHGLRPRFAHSLIGRSIFIRYLEDRRVLVPAYFRRVAAGNRDWRNMLERPLSGASADPGLGDRSYLRVLQSKEFTYAVFRQLASDFNGDMFPEDKREEKAVTQTHLDALRGFLCGDADSDRPQLFFFAYRFDIIPIELISSIYEEFYHTENGDRGDHGTHYTPPSLVEFVLSQVLTEERLSTNPTILDPACGSGIFLVEAFRRIVRYKTRTQNRRLGWNQLIRVIREQIVGVEINEEALRIAAFSLYLAFLHYLERKDILEHIANGRRLPKLILDKVPTDKDHLNNMVAANSFALESGIRREEGGNRFGRDCVDVIVGNPPWGKYGSTSKEMEEVVNEWCHTHEKTVGNKELAQAFVHLSMHFLKPGGIAGLLVPTAGTFLNRAKTSREFRKQWLNSAVVKQIVNFDHVRDVFFHDAIAPFCSVVFKKGKERREKVCMNYWSARKTRAVSELRAVFLSRTDLNLVQQDKVMEDDVLWKVYWWGGHRDEALIDALRLETPLADTRDEKGPLIVDSGRGVTVGNMSNASGFLKQYEKMLKTERLTRYVDIGDPDFEPIPEKVERPRHPELFEGTRILFKQSPSVCRGRSGYLIGRLTERSFCFRHSIYSLRLRDSVDWQAKIILGILWSSLARYYFFLTASSWGSWHDKISLDELLGLPIRLPTDVPTRKSITDVVDQLQAMDPTADMLGPLHGRKGTRELERELDQAIFDLYELSVSERDQITDTCEYGLDLFYRHVRSDVLKPLDESRPLHCCGVSGDISPHREAQEGLEPYLRAFLEIWNRELEPDGEFRWEVVRPGRDIPMLAVVFTTQERGQKTTEPDESAMQRWRDVLSRLDESLVTPFGSKRIYIDGLVRAVSDTEIIIVKRNQRCLWTSSMAREDAEATLLQAVHLQEACGRG